MFFKKSPKVAVTRHEKKEPEVVRVPFPDGHNLQSWRANPFLAESLRKAFDAELFRHFFSVLYNEIPSEYPRRGDQLNDTMANIELGRSQGYINLLNLMRSMAVNPKQTESVEQDYSTEEGEE